MNRMSGMGNRKLRMTMLSLIWKGKVSKRKIPIAESTINRMGGELKERYDRDPERFKELMRRDKEAAIDKSL